MIKDATLGALTGDRRQNQALIYSPATSSRTQQYTHAHTHKYIKADRQAEALLLFLTSSLINLDLKIKTFLGKFCASRLQWQLLLLFSEQQVPSFSPLSSFFASLSPSSSSVSAVF